MKAFLALEDGSVFEGLAFGASGTTCGEACFNTSMTGYQEIITDPSYRGQIVAMTYPLIGNYGINPEDNESKAPQLRGFVIEELAKLHSNWRATESLADDVEVTHINLNDGTIEGIRHKTHPVFCVQYHPEAAPGSKDADYFFDEFAELIENFRKKHF